MRKTTMTRQKRQDRKEKNYDDKAKKTRQKRENLR